MTVGGSLEEGSEWKMVLRKHWVAVAVFVSAAVLAFVGVVYVFVWFTGDAQSSGLVPSSLSLWTMGNVLDFILHLIFWEIFIIGIPVVVAAVLGWQWWKRIPVEEMRAYHLGKRSRTRGRGGGAGLLFYIAFSLKVYLDGKWNVPIATWTLNYVVDSMVTILIWLVIIFGIPITIGALWWIRREMKKP